MNYYFENNLEVASNKIFGASQINLKDYYVCTERWEIVIQDGAGTQLMKATNCDDSQMNCNQILAPDYTPTTTTTRNPIVIPTTTRRPFVPTTSPPATRTRAFFVDTANYLGTMSSDYVYFELPPYSNVFTNQYRHNIKFSNIERLDVRDSLHNNRRNASVGDNGGTAVFYWDDPFTSIFDIGIEFRPVLRFGFAAPGVYYDRFNGEWRNDPNAPQVTSGAGTVNFGVKIYLEVGDGVYANYLAWTKWYSPSDLNTSAVILDYASLFNVPYKIYEEDRSTPASGRIRLELETNLGKDIIYVPWANHPDYTSCGISSQRCDYRRGH